MKIIHARLVALSIFLFGVMGASWSAEIRFDKKNYADSMGLSVGITGTMKGDGVIYELVPVV
jgi:hypothetical protein